MVQLKEHPLQPIANQLKQLECAIQELKAAINALAPGGEGQTIIVTHPPRSTVVNFGKITVTTTPTRIRAADSKRLSISIVNSGAASVYLGDDDTVSVNTGSYPGYELMSNAEFSSDVFVGDIYGVVSAGTVDLTYWEEVEQ